MRLAERRLQVRMSQDRCIPRDFYIECTSRYKGPALHGKCPKSGTDKLLLPYLTFGM